MCRTPQRPACRGILLGAITAVLLAASACAGEVTVSSRVNEDGLTELSVHSDAGDLLKTCHVNLSTHHSPATERTPAVARWESYRLGAFVCYNTNQFTGDELCRADDPAVYAPRKLDVDSWVVAMRAAGMRYAVLTTRHTSGFLLWDSVTTAHDVASSQDKTDVVRAFTDACRKAGIAPGFYYCMWGGEWLKHPNARNIILAQLHELASNYGDIPYFWIDMMNWAPKDLPAQQVYDLLKNLQPDTIVIMNQHIQDGTELKYFPTDVMNGEIHLPPESGHEPVREADGRTCYLPFEFEPVSQQREDAKSVANTPLGRGTWFTYGPGKSFEPSRPFPVAPLYDWIKQAYSRGASNVLLSMAPDHTGGMRAEDLDQLEALGKLLSPDLEAMRP